MTVRLAIKRAMLRVWLACAFDFWSLSGPMRRAFLRFYNLRHPGPSQ